jgi:class I fructose-bisphosphate aldolase
VSAGIQLRMSRLFNSTTGKSVIVAVDHGIEGVPDGLESPVEKVSTLIDSGIDALLINPGLFERVSNLWRHRGDPGVILAADYFMGATVPGRKAEVEDYRKTLHMQDAVRLGADAVKMVLVFGQHQLGLYSRNLEIVAESVQEAHRFGMPVMLETVLWGLSSTDEELTSVKVLRSMMRIGVELGADILKVPLLGTDDEFRATVNWCPVPVTVLGGQTRPDFDGVVEGAGRAVNLGACGIVFGRNVWQRPDLTGAVAALQKVVHGSSVDQ